MRPATLSKKGTLTLRPGPASRTNFPRRCTMAVVRCWTVKKVDISAVIAAISAIAAIATPTTA